MIKWGFLAAGNIANSMAKAISNTEGCQLYAVGARDKARASEFAKKWGFAKSYGSYQEILDDKEIDIVYIATPHTSHAELSIKALEKGKNVLCEKPSAINEFQMQKIINKATEKNLFFMEALWTKFQPVYFQVMQWIKEGRIGEVKNIYADFCVNPGYKKGSRVYEKELGGGALLDVGIYTITYALSCVAACQNKKFNEVSPLLVNSIMRKTQTDVDGYETLTMKFQDELIASLTSAIDSGDTDVVNYFKNAKIIGTKGMIIVPIFFMAQEAMLFNEKREKIEHIQLPFEVNGYEYEVKEVLRILNDKDSKQIESPLHTHSDSLALIRLLDSIRKQWNLVYPDESAAQPTDSSSVTLDSSSASSEKVNSITVYTDGACSGNPGPGGYGAVIIVNDKEYKLSGGEKLTTNNRMELMAAISSLSKIAENESWNKAKIIVNIDSQYVKNGITTWITSWKKNGFKTASKDPVKNQDLWMKLDKLNSSLSIEWKWVKGHAGNKYNEICDELAVTASKNV